MLIKGTDFTVSCFILSTYQRCKRVISNRCVHGFLHEVAFPEFSQQQTVPVSLGQRTRIGEVSSLRCSTYKQLYRKLRESIEQHYFSYTIYLTTSAIK